jgi:hypothetical protein
MKAREEEAEDLLTIALQQACRGLLAFACIAQHANLPLDAVGIAGGGHDVAMGRGRSRGSRYLARIAIVHARNQIDRSVAHKRDGGAPLSKSESRPTAALLRTSP